MSRFRAIVITLVLSIASIAHAGAVIELVPSTGGPYSFGQIITVDVILRNQEPAVRMLEVIQLDFSDSDPAIGFDANFTFDYSSILLGSSFYAEFPALPVPSTVYISGTSDPNLQFMLPASGTLHIGSIDVTIPMALGIYIMDVMNTDDPGVNAGAQLAWEPSGGGATTLWRSFTGELGGGQFAIIVGGSNIQFVDGNGPNSTGFDWVNSRSSLQDALDLAAISAGTITEIRVAQGTYKPDDGVGLTPGDRALSFDLPNGVTLKGGYPGNPVPLFCNAGPRAGELCFADVDCPMDNWCVQSLCPISAAPCLIDEDCPMFPAETCEFACVEGPNLALLCPTGEMDCATPFPECGETIDFRDPDVYVTTLNGDLAGDDPESSCCYNHGSADCDDAVCEAAVCGVDPFCCATRWDSICVGQAVILCGALCPAGTFDSDNTFNIIQADGIQLGVLDGFTVKGGTATGSPPLDGGGGLAATNSDVVIENCDFVFNRAQGTGGAARLLSGGSSTFNNCIFRYNRSGGTGGALVASNSDPSLVNCNFFGNLAEVDAGAVSFFNTSTTLINTVFNDNLAFSNGGAMRHAGGSNSTLTNCLLINNSTGADGGAIFNENGVLNIFNSTVANNTAINRGGGLFTIDPINFPFSANAIFWGSTATGSASGLFQQIDFSGGGNAALQFSILQDDNPNDAPIGPTVLDEDPMFIDPIGNAFGLQAVSPGIDAGSTPFLPLDGVDLDGDFDVLERTPIDLSFVPRAIDDPDTVDTGIPGSPVVDMGALEFFQDCNGNGNPDICDLTCSPANGTDCMAAASCGTASDCNVNGVIDQCEIAACDESSTPACGDCNLNGIPDECDITSGALLDVDMNGRPDNCPIFDDDSGDGLWGTAINWLGNVLPVSADFITIDGGFTVDQDVVVTGRTLRLLNGPTLNVSTNNLTLTHPGGLFMRGDFATNALSTLQVDNGATISVANGPVFMDAGAVYEANPTPFFPPVTTQLNAQSVTMLAGKPGFIGTGYNGALMDLSSNMGVATTGDFLINGDTNPTPYIPVSLRGGAIDRPRLLIRDSATLSVAADFVVQGEAIVNIGGNNLLTGIGIIEDSADVIIGGAFINESTSPELFDWTTGSVRFAGGFHTFEAADIDQGPIDSAFDSGFAMGTIEIAAGESMIFQDILDNDERGGATLEALYVDTLILESGATIVIDKCKVYYRNLIDNSTSLTTERTATLAQVPGGVFAPLPAAGYPHGAPKNRYISFMPNPGNPPISGGGVPTGFMVTHTMTAQSWYVSTPRLNGSAPGSIAGLGLTYLVSDDVPVVPVWDATLDSPVVHVGGCMIAPNETYEVRATTNGIDFSLPLFVNTAAQPTNSRFWSDVVGVFSVSGDTSTIPVTPPGGWTPPDFNVNGFDITAVLRGVQKINEPHFVWTDLNPVQPDRVTNGNDVLRAVNAFATGTGREFYPYDVPNAPGPQGQGPCPTPPLQSALVP